MFGNGQRLIGKENINIGGAMTNDIFEEGKITWDSSLNVLFADKA